jgi:hypothetical protein
MVGVCEGNVCRVEGNFTLIIIYPGALTLCQLPVTGDEVISQIFLNLYTEYDREGRWEKNL